MSRRRIRDRILQRQQVLEGFKCVDCGLDTSKVDEYYMVHDCVWRRAGMTTHGGMLCVGCLETRLGRKLNKSDFPAYPINMGVFPFSERLASRLEMEPPWNV